MRKYPKPGDIFTIPLSDGTYQLGQYLLFDDYHHKMGQLVAIFREKYEEGLDLATVDTTDLLFPPVYASINPGFTKHGWKVIGTLPVRLEKIPDFRIGFFRRLGISDDWRVTRGKEEVFVGVLTDEQRKLEILSKWGGGALVDRIETGKTPNDGRL